MVAASRLTHKEELTMMKIVNVTDVALKRMKEMVKKNGPQTPGIRFGIKAGGCGGFEYVLNVMAPSDERCDDFVVHLPELRIFINTKCIRFVERTTIDWNLMGFTYDNPKAGTSCGCGLSFNPNP